MIHGLNVNVYYLAYTHHKGNDDYIIELWEGFRTKGIPIKKGRNLAARICETSNLKLLTYLMGIHFKFDRLHVYICALEGKKELLEVLLKYQNFKLDWNDLHNKLKKKNQNDIIRYLIEEKYLINI